MIIIKKINIVKKNLEFSKIINNGKFNISKYYSIYIYESKFDYPRFGITISKKLGNAVIRNKIKRQLKNIIDINQNLFKNNIDYIIIVKKDTIGLDYNNMQNNLISLVKKDEWRRRYEKK